MNQPSSGREDPQSVSGVLTADKLETEIETLAALIAGEHVRGAGVLEAAWAVAEAQFQLQRVKAFKITLLRRGTSAQWQEAELESHPPTEFPLQLFQQLESLERYERRALSRRKFAIREFYELAG
jgi:hypothetical protein